MRARVPWWGWVLIAAAVICFLPVIVIGVTFAMLADMIEAHEHERHHGTRPRDWCLRCSRLTAQRDYPDTPAARFM